jgi:hypothetical protein
MLPTDSIMPEKLRQQTSVKLILKDGKNFKPMRSASPHPKNRRAVAIPFYPGDATDICLCIIWDYSQILFANQFESFHTQPNVQTPEVPIKGAGGFLRIK